MTEREAFHQIDTAIEAFKEKEGIYKDLKVSTKAKSDWLIFNWRQLSWTNNDINYLIEIYPTFDEIETINGWNMYAAAYFDKDKKRYYIKKTIVENKTIDIISKNALALLLDSYKYLSDLKRMDIPFAVLLQ
jgi:hypothetical protein